MRNKNQLLEAELKEMKSQNNQQDQDHVNVITELEALRDQNNQILDQASSREIKPISKIKAKMKDPMKITHSLESAKDVNLNVLNRNAFVVRLDNSFSKNCNPVEILRTILKTLGNGNDFNIDPIERFSIDAKSIKFFKNRTDLLRFKIKSLEKDFVDFLIKTQSKESGKHFVY